ncbi:MAG: hypothetical protein FWG11_08665 [Promicromonosporaceae bacterium]|nr:hypothetical protein [Promicromonosporaceae bacterium]
MSGERRPGLMRALDVVRHRLKGHRTALRNAETLGWPNTLSDAVVDTRARLAECEAIEQRLENDMEADQ